MYSLSIVTPEKTVFEGNVVSLNAPGTVGYLEILTNHAPIISTLEPGKLTITPENNKKRIFAISGGILEMSEDKAIILADAIEIPEEIDLKRAENALKRANERLESKDPEIDLDRALHAKKRAENRIKIYREAKSISTPSALLQSFE